MRGKEGGEMMEVVKEVWGRGDRGKVGEGVLGGKEVMWGEEGELKGIGGVRDMVRGLVKCMEEKGMVERVKRIV